jgi:hypothetical protein
MKNVLALVLTAIAPLPACAVTVYVPYVADEVVGSARYRTEIAVTNHGDAPALVHTVFVSADGVRHAGEATTVSAHGSAFLASAVPPGAHGQEEVAGPPGIAVSARLVAYGKDGGMLSSDMESVASPDDLIPAGRTFYLSGPKIGLSVADAVIRFGLVTSGATGSCSFVAYGDTDPHEARPRPSAPARSAGRGSRPATNACSSGANGSR